MALSLLDRRPLFDERTGAWYVCVDTPNVTIANFGKVDLDRLGSSSRYVRGELLGFSVPWVAYSELTDTLYAEMSDEDFELYDDFFPDVYERSDGDWKRFDIELIPLAVLDTIQAAFDLMVFHDLEIWETDEGDEAMAVGVVIDPDADEDANKQYYELARWGRVFRDRQQVEWLVRSEASKTSEEVEDELDEPDEEVTDTGSSLCWVVIFLLLGIVAMVLFWGL